MQDGYLNHSCFLFAWPDAHFCSPSKPEALISIVFLRYQLSVPSNSVHVRFFDKHREHYKLEFGSLPQNCHIAIQYLYHIFCYDVIFRGWVEIVKIFKKSTLWTYTKTVKIVWYSWLLHILCNSINTKISKHVNLFAQLCRS